MVILSAAKGLALGQIHCHPGNRRRVRRAGQAVTQTPGSPRDRSLSVLVSAPPSADSPPGANCPPSVSAGRAHSGAERARRGEAQRLPDVFACIGERARHLHGFIADYAQIAKLPAPRPEPVQWPAFVAALAAHAEFRVSRAVPEALAGFDAAQMEQVLLNLIKNAQEAGARPMRWSRR